MSDLKIAVASTGFTTATGRVRRIALGEVIDAAVWSQMADEHRDRTLVDYDPHTVPAPDEFEAGTSDDPRLEGAPSVHATVAALLDWVGDDVDRATALYERELRRHKSRPSLMGELAVILDGG